MCVLHSVSCSCGNTYCYSITDLRCTNCYAKFNMVTAVKVQEGSSPKLETKLKPQPVKIGLFGRHLSLRSGAKVVRAVRDIKINPEHGDLTGKVKISGKMCAVYHNGKDWKVDYIL